MTTKEIGDALEKNVQHIFNIAKFQTSRNERIVGYEIDVKATIGNKLIIIECKNYQNSNLTIRNLIHQWSSKNELINADKIIIVIAGKQFSQSDLELASKLNIELWSENDLSELFSLSLNPEKLREKLLDKITFREIPINEKYREYITYMVVTPLLYQKPLSNEYIYKYLNKWLRSQILTDLEFIETNKEIRTNHIYVFEGNKTEKKFFNLLKRERTQVEYWNKVHNTLKTEEILPNEIQEKYIEYMNLLKKEVSNQKHYLENSPDRNRTLIESRIKNAYKLSQTICILTAQTIDNRVEIIFPSNENNEVFILKVTNLNNQTANILNWVFTSEFSNYVKTENNTHIYDWEFSSINELTTMVIRIFEEYFQITDEINIIELKNTVANTV
jgi:hypothetical protein